MSATVDFYLSRAAESADAARETTLENVRQRSLRAEAAWLAMANRLILIEDKKKQDANAKAGDSAPAVAVPWPISRFPKPKLKKS